MRVETPDLLLREFLPTDVPDLLAAFADAAIARWNPGPEGPEAAAEFTVGRNDWSDGDHASWAVADLEDRLIGSVSLHKIDPDQGDAEIGYWIAPWARRRGHAVRSVATASRFGFADLGLHRLYLYHAVENPGSCGVARGRRVPARGDAPPVLQVRRRRLPRRAPARSAQRRPRRMTKSPAQLTASPRSNPPGLPAPYRSGVLRLRGMRPGQMRPPRRCILMESGKPQAQARGPAGKRESEVHWLSFRARFGPSGGRRLRTVAAALTHGPGGSARVVRSRGTERDQPAHVRPPSSASRSRGSSSWLDRSVLPVKAGRIVAALAGAASRAC